jgi:Family of unknown function (DUF6491)
MKLQRAWLSLMVMSASIAGVISCSSQSPSKEQIVEFRKEDNNGQVVIHSTFGSSDIKNWRVVDLSRMVIETYSHGDLLATFMQACSGLGFADSLAFSTMGPFQLDRSTSVILPDGRRCQIKSLEPYESPEKDD